MGQGVFIFRVKQSVTKAVPDDTHTYIYIYIYIYIYRDGGDSGLRYTGSDIEGWVAGE